MPDYLSTCEKAARKGGSILVEMRDSVTRHEKGPNDFVTEADLASQDAIRDIVLGEFPDHQFVGEETKNALERLALPASGGGRNGSFRWIVDPLDGTTNYVHGLPSYAVSVALEQDGQILAGVVYDPNAEECFRASRGCGADLNGKPLKGSDCKRLKEALMAVSLPVKISRDSIEITRFLEIMHACQSVRRLGSAALNLCYLAAGRLDGYVAGNLKAWDVAAGMLIIQEAGCLITSIDGSPLDLRAPRLTAAATEMLHTEILEILAQLE